MGHNARTEQEIEETEALNEQGNGTDIRVKENEERKYNLGIGLFFVLNVIGISVIGISSCYISTEERDTVLHNHDICVPCEDLMLHPDDIIEGIERRGKDNTTCCATEEEGPDALVEYYTDHWLKEKLATDKNRQFVRYECGEEDNIEPQKPIIKLVGKQEKQAAEHHKLHWNGDHELAIIPDDDSITHHKEHGFIEIKKSGLYLVYNQVVFDHDSNAHNHNYGPDIYYHSIIVIEEEVSHHKTPREIILVKTTNSHCESKTNKQTITNYLSGAFRLSEGDKLAVRVHNKTELVTVPHMNFFGAYML